MKIFFQHLGRRSISNILQHLGGRSRHIFNQYLGGRPAISICWPECPPLPLKTPSKWRLKPTEPAPICAQTSRHCVHTLSDPPGSRLSLAEDRPQAGGEIFGQHVNILSIFRRELPSQHVNMLSIFRHDVVNSQHQYFGRSESIIFVSLSGIRSKWGGG